MLISIRERHPDLSEEQRVVMQRTITQLTSMDNEVRLSLRTQTVPDVGRFDRVLNQSQEILDTRVSRLVQVQ